VTLAAASNRLQRDHADHIKATLERTKEVVLNLVEVYSKTFRVNFSFANRQALLRYGSIHITTKSTIDNQDCGAFYMTANKASEKKAVLLMTFLCKH
jgi:hypothetical protein